MTDQNAVDRNIPTITPTILTTKLYRPRVSGELESRAKLITRLENNHHRALTLISAPTGYGKSTLASMWLDASEMPGCWISLDEDENDPYSFLAYMVTAIQSIVPDIDLDSQALVGASTFPPLQSLPQVVRSRRIRLLAMMATVAGYTSTARLPRPLRTARLTGTHPLIQVEGRTPPIRLHSLSRTAHSRGTRAMGQEEACTATAVTPWW